MTLEPPAVRDAMPRPVSPFRQAWEWLWRARALPAARAMRELSPDQREFVRRAELAAELAERTLEPTEPLRAGPGEALALSLYREAAYWALRAHAPAIRAEDVAAAFAAVPRELLLSACGSNEALSELQAQLGRTFVETAGDARTDVERAARNAQAFVGALLSCAVDRRRMTERVLLERFLRVGIALLAACAVGVAAARALQGRWLGPDLASGRPWTASSERDKCEPAIARCDGGRTWVFFMTKKERNPWWQVDLGAPRAIRRVEVVNRRECCQDNAIPLVLEVGTDGTNWRGLARKGDAFDEWVAEFSPVTARYVRLRVDRRSTLHLERVSVRGR